MAVTDGRPASAIAVPILYRNWRGLTAVRQIIPQTKEGYGSHTWFGATDWHPAPQWLLHAVDVEKGEARDFAMAGVKAWGQAAVDTALRERADLERLYTLSKSATQESGASGASR
ncbi:MAG: hypothetical protein MIN69_18950 [Methylorubrum extorquens]|jgi:hypothetical protein|uniref:hypothetical protein n=1 Tax=Methylorubrum extorquens TaxID=408 RepID=UPI002FEE27C7